MFNMCVVWFKPMCWFKHIRGTTCLTLLVERGRSSTAAYTAANCDGPLHDETRIERTRPY